MPEGDEHKACDGAKEESGCETPATILPFLKGRTWSGDFFAAEFTGPGPLAVLALYPFPGLHQLPAEWLIPPPAV